MLEVLDARKTDFSSVPVDAFWNTPDEKEMRMHRIHAYPAKFPAFITTKALEFAKSEGASLNTVADVFCGCGTVALEARRNNINFWGCDINPVATLIARAKSQKYTISKMLAYQELIEAKYRRLGKPQHLYATANERLKYWFNEDQFLDLHKLKRAIEAVVPIRSKYRALFLCAFSNILKATSVWLTKSIKPQVDPNKQPADVVQKFREQCKFIAGAISENTGKLTAEVKIDTMDCLKAESHNGKIDMIISSPPYVTSYEYADLHQLSSLWLGFTDDYRDLRAGTIGSLHHEYDFAKEVKRLNATGSEIVFQLYNRDKSKARSVAKYFLDMQKASKVCYDLLSKNGLALFVIGNTEYRGIRMDNVKHLAESLETSGFKNLKVTKRKISRKFLTPYRTKDGKFTSDSTGRKVYSEEFIIVGYK